MRKGVILSAAGVCVAFALAIFSSSQDSAAQSGGPELVIYSGENFTGRYVTVTGTLLDMPPTVAQDPEEESFSWNDNVKSMVVVRGTWRLCENGRLNTKLDDARIEDLTPALAKAKGAAEGWSCLVSGSSVGPVQYALPANGIWGSGISSIELVSEENLPDWASEGVAR